MTIQLLLHIALATSALTSGNPFPEFKEHVINAEAGTGLAITVTDINQDGKPDIVGVSADDVAWYENPTWERHLIADTLRNSNVCVAAHDVDGDGIPELALGADWQPGNTESGGALFLLSHGDDVKAPWEATTLVETEPTLHRIRWADLNGDGQYELIVAPLKAITPTPAGMDGGVKLYALHPGEKPFVSRWREEIISTDLQIMHNIWPLRIGATEGHRLYTASMEGITGYVSGEDGTYFGRRYQNSERKSIAPEGAGEIKIVQSKMPHSSLPPITLSATIEPWHGHQVVVYTPDPNGMAVQRFVLDDTLKGGHAIWFADFDQDSVQELLVGFRENAGPKNIPGLNIYDLDIAPDTWAVTATKHIIDDGGMATEDALAHDMNGDGWPDIVAFGRATHNIKYYENLGKGK